MIKIEDAIENLKGIKSARFHTLDNNESELYEKIVLDDLESLDLAIEALENQISKKELKNE